MRQSFLRVSRVVVGLAVCGLAVVMATDASALTKSYSRPFRCDRANDSFVIDSLRDTCGGISSMKGPGWARYGFPSALGGAYHYITRVREIGSETATWSPTITTPGSYEVWVSYRETGNRTRYANFYVYNNLGESKKFVFSQIGGGRMAYVKLGLFDFAAQQAMANPKANFVKAVNVGSGSSEGIDGAYFRLVKAAGPVADTDADAVPVPGDYDGAGDLEDPDGVTDMAVYHTLSGNWDITSSMTGETVKIKFGEAGGVPVPGDYDGDGTTDLAVFYPSTQTWDIKSSSGDDPLIGYSMSVGAAGAIPVPGNYDGDGITDLALYHQATGLWYIEFSDGTDPLDGVHMPEPPPGS